MSSEYEDLFDILGINNNINNESNKDNSVSYSQKSNTSTRSTFVGFDVFMDELINTPMKPTIKKINPLREISSNKKLTTTTTTTTTTKIDEEHIWDEFDDDALVNMSDSSSTSSSSDLNKGVMQPVDFTQLGFKTASGKALKPISKDAIQKAHDLLMETVGPAPSPPFSGFKTASGKQLKPVSEEAIKKAQALFEDCDKILGTTTDDTTKSAQMSSFFTTASGKALAAPKEESKKLAESLFDNNQVESSNNHLGIKRTASSISLHSRPLSPTRPPSSKSVQETSTKRYKTSLLGKNKQNKPFKSPIIRSNIELTKAAIGNRSTHRTYGSTLFDLTVPKERKKLSSLGKPSRYTRQELLSKKIPPEIIDMTSTTSVNYRFDNWGPKEAQKEILDAGALPHRVPLSWIENHYRWIVWKLACQIRSYPDVFMKDWKPETVLHQLLYRYEREVNQGHRPVLKKILEQDDIAAKHMVLAISDIIGIKAPAYYNTSSKYQLHLTDGWYQVSACIDARMERAIVKGRLKIGHKLSICGAQLVGSRTTQTGLDDENAGKMLLLSANGCLPAAWDTRLGYHPKKYIIRSLPTIFDDGGMVTALDIIVCRKFPMLYTETLPNGKMVTRTAREEEEIRCGYGDMFDPALLIPNFNGEGRSNVSETRPSPEERRVSGYFKIRICDYCAYSKYPQEEWATLLLQNANELNHMDITEGSRYKIFFVVPYHPKTNDTLGIISKPRE
ncbi:unnamed protein product [Rhizopus microsporus]